MLELIKKLTSGLAVLLLVAVGLIALEIPRPAAAADASRFDPGLLISDAAFYDHDSMTVAEIQRFLESKLPTCRDDDSGPKCIRNFVMDTPAATGEDGRCESVEAKTAQTAAQIIHDVAQACKISPKALIVTLQKEQGLIQAQNPTARMYNFALGMNCPDTPAGCAASSAGFFWQLYKGAGQLQWYNDVRGSFSYLKVGSFITRRYQAANVESSIGKDCGSRRFLLKSAATAALYYYTPYTPNDAALKNLYSTGDSCSAYGNRNFWRFYTDWFGDPVAGSFFIQTKTSGPFLVSDNTKYPISDASLLTELKPLGEVGTVSQEYLDTFVTGTSLTRLFKVASGALYIYDNGKRFNVSSCDLAAHFGLDCANAITFTSAQFNALPNGGVLTQYLAGADNTLFYVKDGVRRQILDLTSVTEAGITLPTISKVPASAFENLPFGQPIARNLVTFTNSTTGKPGIFADGKYFEVSDDLAKELDLKTWFATTTGKLSTASIGPAWGNRYLRSIVQSESGKRFLLTTAGKRKVADLAQLSTDVVVPDSLLNPITESTAAELNTPFFAKVSDGSEIFLVDEHQRRLLPSRADRIGFFPAVSTKVIQTLPLSAMKQIAQTNPALAPAALIAVSGSAQNYLIDGKSRALRISKDLAASMGRGTVRVIKPAELKGYSTGGKLTSNKVICSGQNYLADAGRLIPVSAVDALSYPGKAVTLSPLTCANLKLDTAQIGRFITLPDRSIWLVQKSTRYKLTGSQYWAYLGDRVGRVSVSEQFAKAIPIGLKLPSAVVDEVLPEPTPVVTPSPTPTSSPTPTATQTPSPSPSVSNPTAAPSSGPSSTSIAAKTYTVVSGDTLTKIAARYSMTLTEFVAKVKTLNRSGRLITLSTTTVLWVGDKLTIP